ncbi:DUF455 domain-containing protein [Ahniella affigens]|uniref:DUF455 domain-containing protein n=1 Tax=Ahniella affigens TaxID=2021234 RepID=A0A2P1PW16_9GAMM|nr:ferritin-like domain-containing protein [Ahniella affigens]AVP99033.1 DUF455 domain-containing protein [Ahniella affigens]
MHRNAWFAGAEAALCANDPIQKIALTRALPNLLDTPAGAPAQVPSPVRRIPVPGRPERPALVAPRQLQARKLGSIPGRAALVHAVAHIEFNAINLALDAIYRFRDLPDAYYIDWLSVALDEARHFEILTQRLQTLGFQYGDFPAHNGLWQAALDTDHDPLIRMALVPRVLEARGLDVTPGMIARLEEVGDAETVACLRVILAEELNHVAIGTRWYRYLCAKTGIADSEGHFLDLLAQYSPGAIRPPFNEPARKAAGFSAREQAGLERLGMPSPPDRLTNHPPGFARSERE